jgi:hypothetical protein
MEKNKDAIKILKKSMRLKVLLLLGIMLTFNTFAWFVYSNTINNTISTYVKAWRIEFESGEEIIELIEFEIDDLYPGMTEYTNFINVVNYGDTSASLSYEIVDIKILTDTYSSPTYSSSVLEGMLLNDYPFVIEFSLSETVLPPLIGTSDFTVTVNWPYEGGNDAEDTQWGHDSYSFKELYPAETEIAINVKLHANQVN